MNEYQKYILQLASLMVPASEKAEGYNYYTPEPDNIKDRTKYLNLITDQNFQ